MNNITYISIDKLHPHPDNPRKSLGDLTELAESIKATGILQNLTVVPYVSPDKKEMMDGLYTVIIGHRRMAASRLAGLTELPCVIADIPYKEQLATMLLENMQRSDLTVYEQAEGFQLMINLGESVSGIAEKTGFSESTIRRRLKMSELDRNTLKEVSERQIEMKDFDRLAQIEDIEVRNVVLKSIGTSNFNMEVERKLKEQAIFKALPVIKKKLRAAGAKEIELNKTYYGDYEEMQGTEVYLNKVDAETFDVPGSKKQVFYCLQEDIGRLRFYTERKRAAPKKRPQEEIDRENAIKAAHERCREISELSRILRCDFINNLTMTDKNKEQVLCGAIRAIAYGGVGYVSISSEKVYGIAGIENKWNDESKAAAIETILTKPETFVKVIYEGFCDVNETYHSTWKSAYPEHKANVKLDVLYDWLVSLGYEMSDEEKAMQDGTHEVFVKETNDAF